MQSWWCWVFTETTNEKERSMFLSFSLIQWGLLPLSLSNLSRQFLILLLLWCNNNILPWKNLPFSLIFFMTFSLGFSLIFCVSWKFCILSQLFPTFSLEFSLIYLWLEIILPRLLSHPVLYIPVQRKLQNFVTFSLTLAHLLSSFLPW